MPPLLELCPPHPTHTPASVRPRRTIRLTALDLRRGIPIKSIKAASALPPQGSNGSLRCAELDADVETVSVVLADEPDATWAVVGLRLHVGVSVAVPVPVYFTAHVMFTVPENPPAAVSEIVSVADPPAELIVKELDVGDSATVVPVPVRDTVCGEPEALSVRVRLPMRVPPAVGANVTDMVQLAPAATLDPQVLDSAKSPVEAIDVTLSAAAPLLVSVTVCAALVVPVFCAAKVRLVGENAAAGAGGRLIVYEAIASALVVYPLAVAMALTVSVLLTVIGPVYFVEAVVGVEPSVV